MCWIIRWKANVRVPGQTSKQSTNSISLAISTQQISDKNVQFEVDSERQIYFEKLFLDSFIYSQSFCQKSAETKSSKKYFFIFRWLLADLEYEPV